MNDQDRKTEDIKAPCRGCNGVGFNQFEPVCEECQGSGRVMVTIYSDCQCPIEECECEDETRCTAYECDNDRAPENDRCQECIDTAAYWEALYAREHHYTREEIMDAYSDPTEHSKRDILLSRRGDN